MKKTSYLFMAALLMLSACRIVVDPPDPFETAVSIPVSGDPEGTTRTFSVRQGEPLLFRATITQELAAANDQVIFGAAGVEKGEVRVTALRDRAPYVTSTTPLFFSPVDGARLTAQAIVPVPLPECDGPCVAVAAPPEAGAAFFRVESLSSTQTFDLYAYAAPFADAGEPANDALETPLPVPDSVPGEFVAQGAIELVGDEDFFQSEGAVTQVTLEPAPAPLDLRFDVYAEDGELLSGNNPAGSSYTVPSNVDPQGLIARVYSGANRAAPAATSRYDLEFGAVVLLDHP